MKNIKRVISIILLITISAMMMPSTAFAAADFQITSITLSTSTVAPTGGTVSVTITIKNLGPDPITNIDYTYQLPSGAIGRNHADIIASGSSKSYTDSIYFNSNDLDTNIQTVVWCWSGGWVNHNKTINVKSEDNIIRSGGEVDPEQNIYYVGDTVSVTDTMRNSLNTNVTNLKMKYYFRRDDGDTSGDTVTFATLTPNQKVENTIEYTFTDDDLYGLRIGSSVTYYVDGTGPYTEYNVAHDFVVQPSPTPTASPTPTESPTPTATIEPTPTPEPTVDSASTVEKADVNTAESLNNTQQVQSVGSTIVSDRGILQTIIIFAGIIIVLILIVIIVLIFRKK